MTMITGLIVSAVSGKDEWLLRMALFLFVRKEMEIKLFSLGGCKQKKVRPELFITKSDLIFFRRSGEDTEV